uniref:Copine-4 n=1 Tax=Magallana gigas TaxID=29159 RepID=K1Q8E5_MAGGI
MSTVFNTGLGHLAGSKIEILISCTNLADLDDFTKSDPMCVLFVRQFGQWKEYDRTEAIRNTLNPQPDSFFQISRCIDGMTGTTYHPVYRTETALKSTSPRWRPFEINLQPLCNSDWDRGIQFSVWHFSGNDYHMIGRKNTTLREMSKEEGNGSFIQIYLSSPKKETKNKKNTVSGSLRFFQFKIDMQYSLFDFIRGGLQIQPVVAIDFTENQYMDAMDTLGAMISQYSSEQQIALYGFGAKWKHKKKVSHCFPLVKEVFVKGIKSAIGQYEDVLPSLHFSGPTQLAPMLEKAAALAESQNMSQNKQVYTVLLVITDGVINDINRTLRRLIAISHLPLSVVFIGVGPADFTLMEQFHIGLDTPLQNKKTHEVAVRANTHFVAFRKENINTGGNAALAKEAMAALSTQIVQYMKKNNLIPNKPKLIRSDILESFSDDQAPKLLPHSTSRTSLISVKTAGPSCPTCGAHIEPGSQLFSDLCDDLFPLVESSRSYSIFLTPDNLLEFFNFFHRQIPVLVAMQSFSQFRKGDNWGI